MQKTCRSSKRSQSAMALLTCFDRHDKEGDSWGGGERLSDYAQFGSSQRPLPRWKNSASGRKESAAWCFSAAKLDGTLTLLFVADRSDPPKSDPPRTDSNEATERVKIEISMESVPCTVCYSLLRRFLFSIRKLIPSSLVFPPAASFPPDSRFPGV